MMETRAMLDDSIEFKTRERDDSISGSNPFKWVTKTTDELFKGKRIVLFSLPGAFTPTCSTFQVPGFERAYEQIRSLKVDDVYCVSVNDAFVMNAWAKSQSIEKIKMIPDGSGKFTESMGMLVDKDNLGFGKRSWRYAVVIVDGIIEKEFVESGKMDNCPDDPYSVTNPDIILGYLESVIDRFEAKADTSVKRDKGANGDETIH